MKKLFLSALADKRVIKFPFLARFFNRSSDERDADTLAASILAQEAMALPPKTLARLLSAFCSFAIPGRQALIDRALPPPHDRSTEIFHRDRVADLHAVSLAAMALADPNQALDLTPPMLGLPADSDADSPEIVAILLAILSQMYCLTPGVPVEATEPSPTKSHAADLLNNLGPRPANATRSAIFEMLADKLERAKQAGKFNFDASAVATVAAKLGEAKLAKVAADFSGAAYGTDIEYNSSLFKLIGGIAELQRLPPMTHRFQNKITPWLAIATLQLQEGNSQAAFDTAEAILQEALVGENLNETDIVNAVQSVIALHLLGGDQSGALALAKRASETLMALASPRIYSLSILSSQLSHVGDTKAAAVLCRRGYDIYASSPPDSYPEHYYLAYAAYWAGLGDMFSELKAKVPSEHGEIFWVWFVMHATDHRNASPNDSDVLAGGGVGLWDRLIERAIVLGDREKAIASLPKAIQATINGSNAGSLHTLRQLAAYAVCLGRPETAKDALDHAARMAAAVGKSPDGIKARLDVLIWKRALARNELTATMRLPQLGNRSAHV